MVLTNRVLIRLHQETTMTTIMMSTFIGDCAMLNYLFYLLDRLQRNLKKK